VTVSVRSAAPAAAGSDRARQIDAQSVKRQVTRGFGRGLAAGTGLRGVLRVIFILHPV